ncbi:MAG: DUF2807 domain-containing protein [Chlorobi bacterium]|nr:DUF2807 domain-containing protein [Chlorobiota bacterium]
MKILRTGIQSFLLILLLTNFNLFAQTIRGNGNVLTEERKISHFKGLIATGAFEVNLVQGDEEKVVIVADENLHNIFITNVRNENLNIQTIGEVKKAKELKVFVTLKNLNHLLAIGAVDIRTDTTIVTDDLDVFVSGISTVKVNVKANNLSFEITDGAYGFLQGEVNNFEIRVADEAELNAFNLKAKKCNAKISGYSDAKINVSDELKLRVTGAGNLYYKGDPNIPDRIFSGTGFIIKRKNN